MASPSSLLQVLTRFARTLADGYDVAEVLYDLSDSVVSVLGAKGAGVSLAGADGRLAFVTATSDVIAQVERVQQDSQAGPCHVAFMTNELVVVEDISTHDEWPTLRDAALGSGLSSVLGVPLRVQARSIGSLNVYDTGSRVWGPDELAAATVLADIAASYVAHTSELDTAKRLNEQLQTALDSPCSSSRQRASSPASGRSAWTRHSTSSGTTPAATRRRCGRSPRPSSTWACAPDGTVLPAGCAQPAGTGRVYSPKAYTLLFGVPPPKLL